MKKSDGEMPFLDHLEELRKRIFYVLGAVVLGISFSLWAVFHFQVMDMLQAPVLPYLGGEKLTTMSLTEPWEIWIKLSLVGGIVLASPVIFYQIWGFLSPALLPKEKRAFIPALAAGLVLFLMGAWVSWEYLVPFSIKVLRDFPGNFATIVTFDSYMDLVTVLVIAIGIMAELPLLMTVLSWIGIVPSSIFRKFRRHAIVVNLFLGAIISPGTSPVAMAVVTVPLLALYEVGVLGSWLVEKRKLRGRRESAAIAGMFLLLFLGVMPKTLRAQIPPPQQGQTTTSQDTQRRVTLPRSKEDSLKNKRLGIPNGPTVKFPTDTIIQALLKAHPTWTATMFVGDSGFVTVGDRRMRLLGHAGVALTGDTIEGSELYFDDSTCTVRSPGETNVFAAGREPTRGKDLIITTCHGQRMILSDASTHAPDQNTDWFLRGNLAVDSSGKRLFMGDGEFTTCTNEISDYHFLTSEMKWMSNSVLVAKGPILYVADVPVMWLPFLFQDTKKGRMSGIILPKFGFNDIVRPTRGYNRQVTDFGYYWAPSEYVDLTAQVDWYANRYTEFRSTFRYKVRDRFVDGTIGISRQVQSEGGGNFSFLFQHKQTFNATTSVDANITYSTNTSVIQRNTVDPQRSTQQIYSQLNFNKQMSWGSINLGGTRQQELNNGSGSMSFPSLTIQPRVIGIANGINWSPSLRFNNTNLFKTPLAPLLSLASGSLDTLKLTGSQRTTSVDIGTPFQFGKFTLPLTMSLSDQASVGRRTISSRIPGPDHPGDSLNVYTVRNGDYISAFNWNVSLQLPTLLASTFNIRPEVGITNISEQGAFMIRTPGSKGNWVTQGKRLQFAVNTSPNFYSFLNLPIGPALRFRYALSPSARLQWSPAADLPKPYADAISANYGTSIPVKTPPSMQLSIGLNQEFQAKLRPAKGDTTTNAANFKRIKLLSIQTSALAYNFENAKLPHRTGWVTSTLSNSLSSDLLPGFGLNLTHDLWEGAVGTDTAVFKPFLTSVSANFRLSGGTFRSIGAFLGLASKTPSGPSGAPVVSGIVPQTAPGILGSGRPSPYASMAGGSDFSASVGYQLSRTRQHPSPVPGIDSITGLPRTEQFYPPLPDQVNISFQTQFSPTQLWRVSWTTMYDVTRGRFSSHQINLTRQLHDWTASFNFAKAATGNFSLFFSIALKGQEQNVKFDYNQTTIHTGGP